MCAAHTYASFDATAPIEQLPIHEAIRGLADMASGPAEGNKIDSDATGSSVAVLVDAEVDGSRYLLVRMPRPDLSVTQAASESSKLPGRVRNHAFRDRRKNIGHFRRVVVAVKDETPRLRLIALLRAWGFDVVIAKSGIEVLSIFRGERTPDLAILSRTVTGATPRMDGLELCRQIARQSDGCPPWILMLDQSAERHEIVEALESGATDHLPVSFDENELRVRLTAAVRSLERQASLIKERDALREQAMHDGLTGIWNRNAILDILMVQLFRAERNDRTTGILMLDLDHFKSINDSHGHLVGDTVLQETSRRLKSLLRTYDSIGRYGGEEFLVVVPGTDEKELCELAERLRSAIEAKPMLAGPYKLQITLSIGAAIVPPGGRSAPEALTIADAALYKAKKMGRNRIVQGMDKPFAVISEHLHQLIRPNAATAPTGLS